MVYQFHDVKRTVMVVANVAGSKVYPGLNLLRLEVLVSEGDHQVSQITRVLKYNDLSVMQRDIQLVNHQVEKAMKEPNREDQEPCIGFDDFHNADDSFDEEYEDEEDRKC